jgi:hypothetical protein
LAAEADASGTAGRDLVRINPEFMITARHALAWHAAKDSRGGPTFAGSPSWKNFLEVTEGELRARGVIDIFRNRFAYERWFTSDWPDDTNWTLEIDKKKIRVASYGAYSGMTGDEGVTAPLVAYQADMPPESLRGKIAVIPPLTPSFAVGSAGGAPRAGGIGNDYEYLADAATFGDPLAPRAGATKHSVFGRMGVQNQIDELTRSGAAGMLLLFDLPYEVLAGTYSFPIPRRYDVPTLFLDRDSGAQVMHAATSGQCGTVRLIAQTETAETWQLFGFLPGRGYGTPDDEQVMLITHTDGPSISQDNGALGILGIVHYLSKIPRADRPRSIMIFLDTRHYMPGQERAFAEQDHAARNPEFYKNVVAAIGVEHLGQKEFVEGPGQPFHPSGMAELSTVWTTNNGRLVDLAIKAVKDNGLKRVQVQCPGRKGIHGGQQGPWYGLGQIARRLGVPGSATMGSMTAYWSTKARIDALDVDHFITQVATMSQIAGELMVADMSRFRTS